jgi:hypothetical protein
MAREPSTEDLDGEAAKPLLRMQNVGLARRLARPGFGEKRVSKAPDAGVREEGFATNGSG